MSNSAAAEGSCNCGAVKFTVNAALSDIFVCHCSICRKSTGSGGLAVTIVPSDSLVFTSGSDSIRKWEKPNHDWLTQFCKICGSPLPGKNDDLRSYIPVSLLDSGHEKLTIKHHIYVASKAFWEEIGSEGKQHKEAFSG